MSGWLLDTNVISEARRPRPDRKVLSWVAAQPFRKLFISSVTVAEIRRGLERHTDPIRRAALEAWLNQELRSGFADRILDVSEDVLLVCLGLLHDLRKRRSTVSVPDALIAATALRHGLTVATRDVRPFEAAGCRVLNPWEA